METLTTTEALERRIQRLEDKEAIRDLMARYAHCINKGWNGKAVDVEQIPTIFAPDAKWDSPDMGLSGVGSDAIMASLRAETAIIDFSMHAFLNPIVEVDGDSATGNWLMWIGVKREGGARLVLLSLDLRYVRTADGWRIQSALLHVGAMLPLAAPAGHVGRQAG
ncbi:MAG: nuclear transport factor 2 family protein [Pseudomonadota bacterium]